MSDTGTLPSRNSVMYHTYTAESRLIGILYSVSYTQQCILHHRINAKKCFALFCDFLHLTKQKSEIDNLLRGVRYLHCGVENQRQIIGVRNTVVLIKR